MTTSTTPFPNDLDQDSIGKIIYDIVASIPLSSEPISTDPKSRAQSIVQTACVKSAAIAGGLALPPGPIGLLTVLPDLVAIWQVQRQMVSDIAACFGKQAELNRELMVYCLFRHGAATIVREIATQVGERLLVRRVALRFLQQLLQKLGVRITQTLIGRFLSRWIPILGAAGIAAYAYFDTSCVGSTAIDAFSRDIEVEPANGESGELFLKTETRLDGKEAFKDGHFKGSLRAYNSRFAVLSHNAVIYCSSSIMGFQELFTFTDAGSGEFAMQAGNGKFVMANLNNGGVLEASADSIQDWEKFRLENHGDGTVSIKSRATGKFVSADQNRGQQLIADRDEPLEWERFKLFMRE